MKPLHLFFIILLSFVTAFATVTFLNRHEGSGPVAPVKETRLDQIKRTGVLRCGYSIWPPFLTKDPNTGKMGGPIYDITEEIGKQLKLRIDWAGEISLGQMFADLALNRYDMICSPFFATAARAREGDFTAPIFYAPVNLYVRKDDARFDNNYDLANKPDIKFAIMDGEYSAIAAAEDFPAAAKVAVTQLSTSADLYMMVADKKADTVVEDPYTYENFNATHPGVLRIVTGKPLRVIAVSFPLPIEQSGIKNMLDTSIHYLHDSGFIDKTLDKYERDTKSLRPAKPYRE